MSLKTANVPENETAVSISSDKSSDTKGPQPYQKPEVGFYVESDGNGIKNANSDASDNEHKNNDKRKKNLFGLKHWHMIALYLGIYDMIAVNGAYFIALWMRFDCRYSQIPFENFSAFL